MNPHRDDRAAVIDLATGAPFRIESPPPVERTTRVRRAYTGFPWWRPGAWLRAVGHWFGRCDTCAELCITENLLGSTVQIRVDGSSTVCTIPISKLAAVDEALQAAPWGELIMVPVEATKFLVVPAHWATKFKALVHKLRVAHERATAAAR